MNTKNPTPLLLQRLLNAKKGEPGLMAAAMTKFFQANYGRTDLPKTVADFAIYDQLAVTGLTQAQFFQGAFTTARSNFPGGTFQLPQSEHALILGVKIYTGVDAAVIETNWLPGANNNDVRNGVLDVTINGQKVLTSLPLTQFGEAELSATAAGETDNDRGTFYFYEPLVLLGQTAIAANISFQSAVTTANTNLRLELQGVRFIGN